MGPSRLGQDDAAFDPGLPRPPDARASTCSRAEAVAGLGDDELSRLRNRVDRLRVPGLPPDPAAHGRRERRDAAALRGRAARRVAAAGAARARARRPRAPRRPPPVRALGRRGAAGRDRARARHLAAAAARRRAHRQPRHRGPARRSRRCSTSSTRRARRSCSSRTTRRSAAAPQRVVRLRDGRVESEERR